MPNLFDTFEPISFFFYFLFRPLKEQTGFCVGLSGLDISPINFFRAGGKKILSSIFETARNLEIQNFIFSNKNYNLRGEMGAFNKGLFKTFHFLNISISTFLWTTTFSTLCFSVFDVTLLFFVDVQTYYSGDSEKYHFSALSEK